MDLSDGWEPLCKLLGMPVPNEPFTRANDADDCATRLLLKVFDVWFGIFSAVGVTLYCGFWLWNNKDALTYFLK
jgi:hypothetical protein